ncbi:MAG: BatA domain-containing protein [Spirochaetota bacterium]
MLTAAAWPFLALALAAVLVLVIHFIMRTRMRTVVFPSNALIDMIRRNEGMRSRLAHILLLLIRMLIILLLALAAARFFFSMQGSLANASHGYFLIDNSPSMGRPYKGARIIDSVRERADIIARRFHMRAGAVVTIITADGALANSTRYEDTRRTILAVSNSEAPFHLSDAFGEIARIASPGERAAIVLFSDAQPSVFSNVVKIDMPSALYTPQAEDNGNAAIIDVAVPKKILFTRTVIPLSIRVARTQYPPGRIIRAFQGGALASTAAVPAGDGIAIIRLSVNVRSPGTAYMTIVLDNDTCDTDNVFHCAFSVVSGFSIAVADSTGDIAVERLKAAITPGNDPIVFSPAGGTPDAVLCVAGAAEPSSARSAPIRIIIPAVNARAEEVSAFIANAASFGAGTVRREQSVISMHASANDLISLLPDMNERIGTRYVVNALPPDVDTPLIADDGSALLMIRRNEVQRTTSVFIALPFTPDNDAFYSSAAFVVLVNRVLSDAHVFRSRIVERSVGERITGLDAVYASNGVIFSPISSERAARPGFYRTDTIIAAVNAASGEHIYGRENAGRYFSSGIDVSDLRDEETLARIADGMELTPAFIAVLLILLALEMALSSNLRIHRKTRGQ